MGTKLLTTSDVVELVTKLTGKPPHPDTVRNWMAKGVQHPTRPDRRIYLDSIRQGGLRLITREAVKEFLRAMQDPRGRRNGRPRLSFSGRGK